MMNWIKKLFSTPDQTPAKKKEVPLWELDYASIWKLDEPTDFIIALNGYLAGKCEKDEKLNGFSKEERVIYVTCTLEAEVNNGGFFQYFDNSAGNFYQEAEESFRAIGANAAAEICRTAVAAWGEPLPQDWDERRALLEEWEEERIEEIGEKLGECDNAFYAYPDNIVMLQYQYVMEHRDQFTE